MQRLPDDEPDGLRRPDLPALTSRELEVVQLLALQRSTAQIADALSISVNTVRSRAHHAVRKLGAEDRVEAAQTARDRGLI